MRSASRCQKKKGPWKMSSASEIQATTPTNTLQGTSSQCIHKVRDEAGSQLCAVALSARA